VKTLKSHVRIWFAIVLISAGFVCTIWAEPVGSNGPGQQVDNCGADYSDCAGGCWKAWQAGRIDDAGDGECADLCLVNYITCLSKIRSNSVGAGVQGQTPPPNKTGPNSTPTPAPTPRRHPINPHPIGFPSPTPSATPRRHPIKGPPHKLGPSPSPTAKPILLAKPKTTPSPKPTPKKSGHSHSSSHH
jgi:hypothetical protein